MAMFKGRMRQVHFVGIGGIGMSGIAEVLINLGYGVSGSDLRESETTRRLEQLGGAVQLGHRAEHVAEADVVVISSAVKSDNPEVLAARVASIPVIPRAEMLAELMRMKHGIAVAGSHGKTTTTSMVAAILDRAGIDPTVVIGGKVNSIGSNARVGRGEYLVVEADESDGSFLKISPTLAVITNIDPEHMDHYGDLSALKQTFVEFANKIPFYGICMLCLDSEHVQSLIPQLQKRYATYGFSSQADYHVRSVVADGLNTRFTPICNGQPREPITLRMIGKHNVLNAMASIAVADELEIPYSETLAALEQFTGVQRRFTVLGEARDIMVVDDYGHHPTEIRATLSGARAAFDRRLVAVFQPHRYSRVRDQFDQFATSFNQADHVVVTPIYPAGESPLEGITGNVMARAIRRHGHRDVHYCNDLVSATEHLSGIVRAGDIVITLGAGNVWQVGSDLLEVLQK